MAFCKYLCGCAICLNSAARNPSGRDDGRLIHCFLAVGVGVLLRRDARPSLRTSADPAAPRGGRRLEGRMRIPSKKNVN
eukprot:1301330-Alexandrium_andersonii.AAC.1